MTADRKPIEHFGEPDWDINKELREWLGDALETTLSAPDFCCWAGWAHELECAMVRRGFVYKHECTNYMDGGSIAHKCAFRLPATEKFHRAASDNPLRARRDAAVAAMRADKEAKPDGQLKTEG